MSSTVLYMSMSLDGFVAGPNESPDNPLGDGGKRLHEWIFEDGEVDPAEARPPGVDGEVIDRMRSSGAVVVGRPTFEMAGGFDGDHHDGVPIFVLSRRPPASEAASWPLVSYVGDVGEAMDRARAAAGEREVMFHGVGALRVALEAGVLDELQIHLVPVLLGQGRRLFEGLPAEQVGLEQVEVREGEGALHLRYRVHR